MSDMLSCYILLGFIAGFGLLLHVWLRFVTSLTACQQRRSAIYNCRPSPHSAGPVTKSHQWPDYGSRLTAHSVVASARTPAYMYWGAMPWGQPGAMIVPGNAASTPSCSQPYLLHGGHTYWLLASLLNPFGNESTSNYSPRLA